MKTPEAAGHRSKHNRVSRACDFCRFKKAKCDRRLICATCVQHNVPCIRDDPLDHRVKPRDLSGFFKQVMYAYQACKSSFDMPGTNHTANHDQDNALPLLDVFDTELEDSTNRHDRKHSVEDVFMHSSPIDGPSSTEGSPRTSVPSLTSLSTGSDASFPLYQAENFRPDVPMTAVETSVAQPFEAAMPCFINPSDCSFLNAHDAVPQLFDNNLDTKSALGNDFSMPETLYDNKMADVIFNDFGFYNIPGESCGSVEQEGATSDDWGFDPVSAQSETQAANFATAQQVLQLQNSWDSGAVPTDLPTLLPLDTTTSPPPLNQPPLPPTPSNTPPPHSPTAAHTPPQDPPGPNPTDSSSHYNSNSFPSPATSPSTHHRQITLLKNRQAAAKCRDKKKRELNTLRSTYRGAVAENERLKVQMERMREEILGLRWRLLARRLGGEEGEKRGGGERGEMEQ